MFVDASALVAIMTDEPEADVLADAIESSTRRVTSPVAMFETVLGVRRKRRTTVEHALAELRDMVRIAAIEVVAITPEMTDAALDASARYGKGQGHPAQLNMGDCFAYAGAKLHRTALLFKGDDFPLTDIEAAIPR